MSVSTTIQSALVMDSQLKFQYPSIKSIIDQNKISVFQISGNRPPKFSTISVPEITTSCAALLSGPVMLSNRTKKIIVYCNTEFNIPNSEFIEIIRPLRLTN